MKIFNLNADEWDRTEEREGWRFKDAWVGAHTDAELIGASMYEVEPGRGHSGSRTVKTTGEWCSQYAGGFGPADGHSIAVVASQAPPTVSCGATRPKGVAMTSIQPQLWVDRPGEALVFYAAAFGATVLGRRTGEGDDIVAQLEVGGAPFWIAPASSTIKNASAPAGDRWRDRSNNARGGRPGRGRPTGSRRGRDGNVAGQRRTRLAARPDPRPVRPGVGDRRAPRALAAEVAVGSLAGMVIPAD